MAAAWICLQGTLPGMSSRPGVPGGESGLESPVMTLLAVLKFLSQDTLGYRFSVQV